MAEQPDTRAVESQLATLAEFVERVAPGYRGGTAEVDAAAAEVLSAFEAAGVEALLLKGRALAALLYEPAEHRFYVDADLLVSSEQLEAAEEALSRLGYENAAAVRGADDVGAVVAAHPWIRSASGDGAMIDLHHWLPGSGAPPDIAWGALSARRAWIQVAGRQVATLDRAGQAMHLAMHAAQHGTASDKNLDELALALERWPPPIWDAAGALADEIGATEAFAAGLRLVPRGVAEASRLGLPTTPELDWKIRHRRSRPRGTFHLQALAGAESTGGRVQILRRSLLPSRAWITYEFPWARAGGLQLIAAYCAHLARAPVWATRAWLFNQRARRARR